LERFELHLQKVGILHLVLDGGEANSLIVCFQGHFSFPKN
jgi:hypothetical protein